MTPLIGTTIDLALQNPIALLNVSFLAPITFVPILVFYEFAGELFDYETVGIPYSNLKFETIPRKPNDLYSRIPLTGPRLRSLIYAFGVVGLNREKLVGRFEGKHTCFGRKCSYKSTKDTETALGAAKMTFGPQFNFLFYKDSVTPEQLYMEHYGFEALFRHLVAQTDKFMYIFKVQSMHLELGTRGTAKNGVKLVCLACDENWGIRNSKVKEFRGEVFTYNESRSFWNQIPDAVRKATSGGTKLHWSRDDAYFNWRRAIDGDYCSDYQHGTLRLNNFGFVRDQLVFSLFPRKNFTAFAQMCTLNPRSSAKKFGMRFHVHGAENSLDLVILKELETFDEAFMFITDQNVTSKRYAADLYLKAFDVESWIAVLVAGGVTCCALAMLAKTSKMKLLSGFWDSMRYLGAYFLDQCPSTLPFPDVAVRSKKALPFVVVPWMMAILILSNGFRGVMKSNYVNKFPYETTLQSWENYKDFQLFTIARNDGCKNSYSPRSPIDEAFIWWAVNGRSTKQNWCFRNQENRPMGRSHEMVMNLMEFKENPSDFETLGVRHWLALWTDLFRKYSAVMTHKPPKVQFKDRIALVCVRNLSQYSGLEYHKNIAEWNKPAKLIPAHFSFNFTWVDELYKHCDGTTNFTFRKGYTAEPEDYTKAFWMTRRHESAYVIRKSEFPWYWNLFKKAMVNDSRVQFAHTGGAEVTRKTKRAIYERNDSPFYVFVRDRYMDPANWMIKRIYGIQESGIFNLWYKWDMILRPPVNESLNEEVSETFDEVRELRLADPGITFLINVTVLLMLAAVAVFALELLTSLN